MENYVSVQVGCLRFLDSYRFLSSSLQKLIASLDTLKYMNSEGLIDDSFKKKLAYPYEKFNLNNFQEPLNLTKEDFWSTLTQSYPCDDDIKRTQQLIDKYNITTPQQLTMLYSKMDVLQLTGVFENFVETSTLMYGINPLYSYSLLGYTWIAGLKLTDIKLDFITLAISKCYGKVRVLFFPRDNSLISRGNSHVSRVRGLVVRCLLLNPEVSCSNPWVCANFLQVFRSRRF